jgi:hypothetical protein
MNILLYNPDNGVTRNFMPHLWMFLLKSLTPVGHEVFLIDGNAQPLTEGELAAFVRENNIELAGIGAMTRMALRAYRMADAIRSAGALWDECTAWAQLRNQAHLSSGGCNPLDRRLHKPCLLCQCRVRK